MSLRVSTSVIQKERQSLQLDDFKGVDFSSSPLKVQTNRATEMSNFINEYGVNKKRNGWNELIRIKHNGVNQKINIAKGAVSNAKKTHLRRLFFYGRERV